jgi:transcriptional regulator with XRE-family HTH domain
MNAVERVKTICKERKIPISKLESDCGFSNGYIGQLRKGTFPNDRLLVIAEYLDISTEYLSTGKTSEFSKEMALIDVKLSNMPLEVKEYALKLSKLSIEKQKQIMNLIDMLEV